MRLLAIETATIDVAAALVTEEGTLGAFAQRGTRRHTELLHPAIVALLDAHGLVPADLEAVAVDLGPGLFTGLRVGIAAAKAFACALSIPVAGVASTGVLTAAAVAEADGDGVAAVVDMRRGEVAWSLPGEGRTVLGTVEELVGRLERRAGERLLLVGDGSLRYEAELRAGLRGAAGVRFGGAELAAPPAEVLGALGLARVAAGQLDDPYLLAPVYLREADARANFATREVVPG